MRAVSFHNAFTELGLANEDDHEPPRKKRRVASAFSDVPAEIMILVFEAVVAQLKETAALELWTEEDLSAVIFRTLLTLSHVSWRWRSVVHAILVVP